MSFLHRSLLASERRNVCLDFFFHGNGTTLQRSPLGMFRSLLLQLYRQSLEARTIVFRAFDEKKAYGEVGRAWEWRVNELRDLFFDAVVVVTRLTEVTILVDALDEAVDEEGSKVAEELVDYFYRLNDHAAARTGHMKICISCRHYPNVAVGNGLQIWVERENGADLETFVRDQLENHVSDWDHEPLHLRNALRATIVEKAGGQFQWARIRVPEVAKSLNDGLRSFEELNELIGAESSKLSTLYEKILSNIETSLRARALQFMQWVCLAERPMSLVELRFAIACDDDHISSSRDSCEELKNLINSDDRMRKLARSLSGGLAEVKYHAHGNTVQLIHQTVNDFLRSRGFELMMSKSMTETLSENEILGKCENRLARSCLNYLTLGNLINASHLWEEGDEREFCFVNYATKYWTLHAERAECRGVTQEKVVELLEQRPEALKSWMKIYNAIDPHNARRPAKGSILIHVASSANLRSVVKLLLYNGVPVDETTDYADTALHCAARSGHEQLVDILLDRDADVEARNSEQETPLERAAANGHEGVVQLLLKRGAEINKQTGYSGSALESAAMKGNPALVDALIRNGADVNFQGDQGGNALQAAASYGHESVVKLLVARGASVNAKVGLCGSTLQAAVTGANRDSLARFLLAKGADVNAQGGKYGNALQAAAKFNHIDIVRLLLNKNADVNASGGKFGNALQAAVAAVGANESLVRLLLDRGADVNAVGGFYGSAIQAAATATVGIVELLIERGADISVGGGQYGTPLQAAAWAGNKETVLFFLNHGADVKGEGGEFGNALLAAICVNGNESLVELLLDHGANVNASGPEFRNALEAAVYWGRTRLFQLLLERGAEVNAPVGKASNGDPFGPRMYGNVLQMAAYRGNATIVRHLLDLGAEVNAQGGWYGSALQAAVSCGHQEVVRLLLERGADINKEGAFARLLHGAKGRKAITKLLLDHCQVQGCLTGLPAV
jgi:ankyrin repeat protein